MNEELEKLILKLYTEKHSGKKFVPGKDMVRYAGRVFDQEELLKLVDASLDFWLTEGRFAEEFTEKIADYLDVSNVILTNSGSSSNLIAFSSLTSKKLGSRRLMPGDEVISVAAGFPATVTPIIQNGMVPVFVDVDLKTYNINIDMMKKAISSKTRAVFIAHTLGNPFAIDAVLDICREHDLWLIEDNCDAFGSTYRGKYTGTFGHVASFSFYPAHHITTGEGGAVVTDDEELARIIRSFRDWGRDCYCAGGENNTCGKRFSQQFGTLPYGYDHKYVYSEIGYNLKMTDMQAAIGSAQMDKIDQFCARRRENFAKYQTIFSRYGDYFILPEATPGSNPAWFSYIITVKENQRFNRDDIVKHLNEHLIETRYLFAGNIIRQPLFEGVTYRVAESLENTDYIMNNTFFLGTYPGITCEMMEYMEKVITDFMHRQGC
ncbi:MAG: lipopolysaccharide biosynthesis protein RfbH [Spirochaetae bacterium HGW-Spirochaetae-5]|jgi:CDP-6-deoxy-D-xylo-4-hexulose-3-dehydrase|nr:MAG: lipopolysaccharide biosynthesis protein RfbH [Spirochaetae bacterium HGW-Spirochaetae-5]